MTYNRKELDHACKQLFHMHIGGSNPLPVYIRNMAEQPHNPGEPTFLPYPQITIDHLDENNWLNETDENASNLTVNSNDIMILVPGALCMMTLDYDWFIKLTNIVTGRYSKTTDIETAIQHTIEALVAAMESDGAIDTNTRERIIAAANRVLNALDDGH